jgi:hypothetical protein
MSCQLCIREKLTEWKYEDGTVLVARCASHPDKWLIILKRHTPLPTPDEAEHMRQVADKLFPGKQWRYPQSIRDHFHLHESS